MRRLVVLSNAVGSRRKVRTVTGGIETPYTERRQAVGRDELPEVFRRIMSASSRWWWDCLQTQDGSRNWEQLLPVFLTFFMRLVIPPDLEHSVAALAEKTQSR